MKRRIYTSLLCMLMMIFCNTSFVCASNSNNGAISFSVSTDVDYTGDIKIILTNISTENQYEYTLKYEDGYKATYSIFRGYTYKFDYKLESDEFELIGYQKEYDFENNSIANCIMKIQKKEVSNDLADNTDFSDMTDEDMFDLYLETIVPILSDVDSKSFLQIYKFDKFKQYYMENGGTEEEWENMNELDSFLSYYTCYYPIISLSNSDNQAKFLENLTMTKTNLQNNQIVDWELVYDATVNMWKYIWKCWIIDNRKVDFKKSFTDYMNDKEGIYLEPITDEELLESTLEDKEQNQNISDDKVVEENSENKDAVVKDILKNNLFSISLLLIICIVAMVVYIKKQLAKNKDIF